MWLCRVPSECPQEIDALIASCTDPDPNRRPTAKGIIQQILKSPRRATGQLRLPMMSALSCWPTWLRSDNMLTSWDRCRALLSQKQQAGLLGASISQQQYAGLLTGIWEGK